MKNNIIMRVTMNDRIIRETYTDDVSLMSLIDEINRDCVWIKAKTINDIKEAVKDLQDADIPKSFTVICHKIMFGVIKIKKLELYMYNWATIR